MSSSRNAFGQRKEYHWQSLQDPSQIDTATVTYHRNGVTAEGTQRTSQYTATWSLDASLSWTTRRLNVSVDGNGKWARSLDLRRDPVTGKWFSSGVQSGNGGDFSRPDHVLSSQDDPTTISMVANQITPGLASGVKLGDASDCIISGCPMMCVVPIRRLGLLENNVPKTQLPVAMVQMPSLQVIASSQSFASSMVEGEVLYSCDFEDLTDVKLLVDNFGMVTSCAEFYEMRAFDG